MLKYSHFASPLGPIFLAKSALGICRVQLGGSEPFFKGTLRSNYHGDPVRDDSSLQDERETLRHYFEKGSSIDGLNVEFLEGTSFERSVWDELTKIPQGEVRSYGEISRRLGRPKAARAVGRACGSNPIPIIVPCHRVIASGGNLGGYGYGLEVKRKLLELEGLDLAKLSKH